MNVSTGSYHDGLAAAIPPSDLPAGLFFDLIEQVKAATRTAPVFAVGELER